MQNTKPTARTDDAPKPSAPERLPRRHAVGTGVLPRRRLHACARCRTVAELLWSALELVCIGCLPTPTVADRSVW